MHTLHYPPEEAAGPKVLSAEWPFVIVSAVSLIGISGSHPRTFRQQANGGPMGTPPADPFPSTPRVIFVADLAGFAASFRTHADAEMAALLDRFYAVAEGVITS